MIFQSPLEFPLRMGQPWPYYFIQENSNRDIFHKVFHGHGARSRLSATGVDLADLAPDADAPPDAARAVSSPPLAKKVAFQMVAEMLGLRLGIRLAIKQKMFTRKNMEISYNGIYNRYNQLKKTLFQDTLAVSSGCKTVNPG